MLAILTLGMHECSYGDTVSLDTLNHVISSHEPSELLINGCEIKEPLQNSTWKRECIRSQPDSGSLHPTGILGSACRGFAPRALKYLCYIFERALQIASNSRAVAIITSGDCAGLQSRNTQVDFPACKSPKPTPPLPP